MGPGTKMLFGWESNFSSRESEFRIPDNRVNSVLGRIGMVIKDLPYTSARTLAKVCGKIISTKFVLGNIVQLKTRRLYQVIEKAATWDGRVSLVHFPEAVSELFFWEKHFVSYNHRELSEKYVPNFKGFSDASSTGLAAHINIDGQDKVVHKNFSADESTKSSTWRELYAIYYSIVSLKEVIACKKIQWHTDNYAASLIFESGSNKGELQNLSERIFEICKKNRITVSVKWISREYIPRADDLSKRIDYEKRETFLIPFLLSANFQKSS